MFKDLNRKGNRARTGRPLRNIQRQISRQTRAVTGCIHGILGLWLYGQRVVVGKAVDDNHLQLQHVREMEKCVMKEKLRIAPSWLFVADCVLFEAVAIFCFIAPAAVVLALSTVIRLNILFFHHITSPSVLPCQGFVRMRNY